MVHISVRSVRRASQMLLVLAGLASASACSGRDPVGAPSGLEVSVDPDRAAMASGQLLTIRVALVNRGVRRVSLSGSSTGTLWVEVRDPTGRPMARIRGYTDDLARFDVAPGASLVRVWEWDGRTFDSQAGRPVAVPPVEYLLVGRLTATEARAESAPRRFTILAP